jgi:dihydrofolate reductase
VSRVIANISVSLDGYVAGPDASMEHPLGVGGEALHEWAVGTRTFRERHGGEGGETGLDDDLLAEMFDAAGASVMGRKMFSGGEGPWESDANANGWWGDDPPFDTPVFVLTHHERAPLRLGGTEFTFVTDGIASALEQARAAAGDRVVGIGGGAETIQQYLHADLVDELQLHIAPVMLGSGRRLFENHAAAPPQRWRRVSAVESPSGTVHLSYVKG